MIIHFILTYIGISL